MMDITAIILAAGKGTRMKSKTPKVLHTLLGKPILAHVLQVVQEVGISSVVTVLGHGLERISSFLKDYDVVPVIQEEQRGTAHAIMCVTYALKDFKGEVLILCGDAPLFEKKTIKTFLKDHVKSQRKLSILTAEFKDPSGYGRIIRDKRDKNKVFAIVEEKDASQEQRKIKEINTGVYAVDSNFLFDAIASIGSDNVQGEYYLTDIVGIAHERGFQVGGLCAAKEEEALGVNSRFDLSRAEEIMLERLKKYWMEQGVTFQLVHTCYIEADVKLARDVVVGPHCVILGNTMVGEGTQIGAFSYLKHAAIPRGSKIPPYSYVKK